MDQSSIKNVSKWEDMSRDELIEFIKKLLFIQKKLKHQIKGHETPDGQEAKAKLSQDSQQASTESESTRQTDDAETHNFLSRYSRLLTDYEILYNFVEERLSALEQQERHLASVIDETFELLKPILSRFRARATARDAKETTECYSVVNEPHSHKKDQQIKLLSEQLQIAKQDIAQKSLAILELEDYRNLVQDLHEQIKSLRVQIEKRTEAASLVNERCELLTKERDDLSEESNKYKMTISSLDDKVTRIEATNSSLQSQLDEAAVREAELKQRALQLTNDLSDMTHKLKLVEDERKKERVEWSDQIADKCGRIAELEKTLQLQIHDMQDIKVAYENALQEHANYKRKVAEVLRRNSHPDSGAIELKSSQEKLIVFKRKLEESEGQLTTITKELAESRIKINKQQRQIAQLSERIRTQEDVFQNEIQELKSSLVNGDEKLKEDLHHYKCENIQLRNLNQELLDSSKKLLAELADKERKVYTLQYDLNAMSLRAQEMAFKSERLEKALEILRENSKVKSSLNRDDDSKVNGRIPSTQLEVILRGDYTRTPSKVLFSDNDESSDVHSLAEMEAENLRLKELATTLKLELTRVEANEKRRLLLEKGEYLKNVLLKFLSINDAGERTVLIPVISKLLVLNEEETERLKIAAAPGNWW